jgi:hypothetical protein
LFHSCSGTLPPERDFVAFVATRRYKCHVHKAGMPLSSSEILLRLAKTANLSFGTWRGPLWWRRSQGPQGRLPLARVDKVDESVGMYQNDGFNEHAAAFEMATVDITCSDGRQGHRFGKARREAKISTGLAISYEVYKYYLQGYGVITDLDRGRSTECCTVYVPWHLRRKLG